jgi:cation-transporting ATPase 13A1
LQAFADVLFSRRNKPDQPFAANLLNTCVFLVSSGMQISTFAINYKGHPFKESLLEHRPLLYCLVAPALVVLLCAAETVPAFNAYMECVPFPDPVVPPELARQ